MNDKVPEKILRIRVTGPVRTVSKFLAEHPREADFVTLKDGIVDFETIVPERLLPQLDRDGVKVAVLFDVVEHGRERLKEVGVGNRFKDGGVPVGLGIKRG